MIVALTRRMLKTVDLRLLWRFAWNAGVKGVLSVRRFEKRLAKGEVFPPFLFISVTSSCNLRCTGCWVDVDKPKIELDLEDLDRIVTSAKAHGNSFFGILGGEPFLHPQLVELFERHSDCYFQVFTNGHPITDRLAARLRAVGNVTPMISVEGTEEVSDERRGRKGVLARSLSGIEACHKHGLIFGVATSVCQNNYDDVINPAWLDRLVELGAHYAWFHTYRPVGPKAAPELCLTSEQVVGVRRFGVEMRSKKAIAIVDPYWDAEGNAMCPAATGISHHIGPGGHIEPCPIIQFACENVRDGDIFDTMTRSKLLADFRETAAGATRGCIVLDRPDLLAEVVERHDAADSTARGTAHAELHALVPSTSQHVPGAEIPEEHWAYRFAKRHWYFGFGAYS